MIPFNLKYLPIAFGFNNLGATCYFNGLLQSLLTCTSLTETFLKNKNNPKFKNNNVAMVYLSIIELFQKYNHDENIKRRLARKSPELWYSMMSYLKTKGIYRNFGRGQEDTHEAFIMLMQCWEDIDEINVLFEHTCHDNYFCPDCKKTKFTLNEMKNKKYDTIKTNWKQKSRDITNGKYNYEQQSNDVGWISYNTHFIIPHNFNSTTLNTIKPANNLQEYILCQRSIHEGVKCIHCNSTQDKIACSALAVIPEILVIVIKKYKFDKMARHGSKLNYNTPLPKLMEFDAPNGKKHIYYPISQILHSGGIQGGHYWAHTIRRKGNDYCWFDLNDTTISSISDTQNFVSSAATYTIFYHKISNYELSKSI